MGNNNSGAKAGSGSSSSAAASSSGGAKKAAGTSPATTGASAPTAIPAKAATKSPNPATAGSGGPAAASPLTSPGAAASHDAKDDDDLHIDSSLSTSSHNRVFHAEDFIMHKVIGRGSFGKVMLVSPVDDPTKVYAMKILKKKVLLQRNQIGHTKAERSILQSVNHRYIVRLHYAFQNREKLYLVTDFAAGGELFFWLKREKKFSERRAKQYAAEILLALEHLHGLNIVYRDLKPENILLDAEGHIKITDFGLSKTNVVGMGAKDGTKTFCGTPEYLAPEILECRGHGKAVDWWSLGTLLYEMMAGLPPFYDTNMQVMYEKILHAPLKFPSHFSPQAVSVLQGLLTRNVEERLGSKGAAEIKAHPFFADMDWTALDEGRVEPEWVPPKRANLTDVSHFDKEFTGERPVDTPVRGSALSTTQAQRTHFDGFTFAGDAAPINDDDE